MRCHVILLGRPGETVCTQGASHGEEAQGNAVNLWREPKEGGGRCEPTSGERLVGEGKGSGPCKVESG